MPEQSNAPSPLVEAYRRRFNIEPEQELPPTLETLQLMIELSLQHLPFENLSLHMVGEQEPEFVLTQDEIMHKLFIKKRGGCCLELNGLFSFLLQDLGFSPVTLVPCYVHAGKERGKRNKRATFRAIASHFVILVEVASNQYLVDVGLGEPALGPLRYSKESLGTEQTTADGMKSRIIADPQGSWTDAHGKTRRCLILEWWKTNQEEGGGYWEPRLQWDVADAPLNDDDDDHAGERNAPYSLQHFQYVIPILKSQKSNHYRKSITCVLTRTSKLSLSGRRLRLTSPRFGPEQSQTVQHLESDEDVVQALKERFGIELQANERLDLTKSCGTVDPRLWDHL